MKNIIKIVIISVIFLPFIGGCSTPPGPNSQLVSLVPDQTVIWVQTGNFNELMDRAEAMISSAELGDLTEGKSLRDLMYDSTGFDFQEIFDLDQPVGFGLLKIDNQVDEKFYMTVTVKDTSRIEELIGNSADTYWELNDSILQLSSVPIEKLTFKNRFRLDLADAYDPISLSYVMDFKSLKDIEEFDMDSAFETMDKLIQTGLMQNPGNLAVLLTLYEDVKGFMTDIVNETNWISGCVGLNELGLYTKSDIRFKSGGNISRLLKSLKGLGEIKSLMKYLPQRSFVSSAMSINAATLQELVMDLSMMLIEGSIEDEDMISQYEANLREMADVLGPQEAFGMQFDLDFQKLIFMSQSLDQGSFDAIADVFDLQGFMAYDLAKNVVYSDLLEENIEMSNRLLDNSLSGFGLSLSMYLDRNQEVDGFVFDEMGFVVDSETGNREMVAIVQVLLDKIRFYYHQDGAKLYGYLGSGDINAFKEYVDKDGLGEKSYEATAFYKNFEKLHPENRDLFFQFSFANMFGSLFAQGDVADQAGSPGIVGGVSFDDSSLSTFALLSQEELATLVSLGGFFQAFAAPALENAFGDI